MHIPENYLSPSTCAVMTAAMVPVWTYSIKKVKAEIPKVKMPLLGIGAAFSFLGMMFNIPLPGGTTGHAVGGNCLDFAGNTGVDRHCHECVGIADLLPHQHGIPRLYKRCTGCTDMHTHGNPHQFRQRQRYRSTVFCVLMVCQMHAMQFLHRIQLLSLFRIALHLYIYRNGVVSAIGVGNDL